MTRKFTNLPKCLNYQFIGTLSGKDFRCSGELGGSTPTEDSWKKIVKIFLSFHRPSVELSGYRSRSFGKDQLKTTETPARCSGLDCRCAERRLVDETTNGCRRKIVDRAPAIVDG